MVGLYILLTFHVSHDQGVLSLLARGTKVTLARYEMNPRVFIQRNWQSNVIDMVKSQSNGTGGVNSLAYMVPRYLEYDLFQGSAYLLSSAP